MLQGFNDSWVGIPGATINTAGGLRATAAVSMASCSACAAARTEWTSCCRLPRSAFEGGDFPFCSGLLSQLATLETAPASTVNQHSHNLLLQEPCAAASRNGESLWSCSDVVHLRELLILRQLLLHTPATCSGRVRFGDAVSASYVPAACLMCGAVMQAAAQAPTGVLCVLPLCWLPSAWLQHLTDRACCLEAIPQSPTQVWSSMSPALHMCLQMA